MAIDKEMRTKLASYFEHIWVPLVILTLIVKLSDVSPSLLKENVIFLEFITILVSSVHLFENRVAVFDEIDNPDSENYFDHIRQPLVILFVTILFVAFAIRLRGLGTLSLYYDENITGMVVTRILETGLPSEPGGYFYYWRGVAYHYFVALFTFIYGSSEAVVRFPSVIFGVGVIAVSFYTLLKIDRNLAILCAVFLTFSPYNFEYSQFARFYIMNAFIFSSIIYTSYQAYFNNSKKYKIITFLLGVVMVHSVQLGRAFIFLPVSYFLLSIIQNRHKGRVSEFWASEKQNILFTIALLPFAAIGNILKNIYPTNYRVDVTRGYEVMENIPRPEPYPLVKFPDWYVPSFFDTYHIPTFLFVLGLILGFVSIYQNTITNNSYTMLDYLTVLTPISILAFELFNRNTSGSRVFLYLEPLIVIFAFLAIITVMRHYLNSSRTQQTVSLLVVALLLFTITPSFIHISERGYGEIEKEDPFLSSHCIEYRADMGTPYEYVSKNIRENDTFITVGNSPYFYIQESPDYVITQTGQWERHALYVNGTFVTGQSVPIISNSTQLESSVSEQNRTWIVANSRYTNLECSDFVRPDISNYLDSQSDNIVYIGNDGSSKVYLINP